MERANGSTAYGNPADGQAEIVFSDLDEKVAGVLGNLSTRACAIDKRCMSSKVPGYVGDYLLARYGDDEVGLQKAFRVLFSAYFVSKGMPPIGNETICRVFGMRRVDADVYGITTTSPLLHRLGIEGDVIRVRGLLDGSWCQLSISRQIDERITALHLFDNVPQEDLVTSGSIANHSIDALQPIREEVESVKRVLRLRSLLTTEEWVLLLLRSYGLGGEGLDFSGRLRLLSRIAPLAEPGLRVLYVHDDECARSFEMSPYEVLVEQLRPDHEGFPGSWDCVAVDGEPKRRAYELSMLLDEYEGIATGVSVAAVCDGSVMRESELTMLFGPFHLVIRVSNGYEGDRGSDAEHLGVNRCLLGELWHELRNRGMPHELETMIEGASGLSASRREAARLALSGIAKVLYPDGVLSVAEAKELIEFVLPETHPND